MIAWLNGRVQAVMAGQVVLDVGGVGYLVAMPSTDDGQIAVDEELELFIHTVVREDSFSLYGFTTIAAREMFKTILSISGVGPKGALALLTSMAPSEIARAIHDDKPRALTVAKGIGKRTAELIVVRLRERLPEELLSGAMAEAPTSRTSPWTPAMNDAKSALINLGFRSAAATRAVEDVAAQNPDASDVFELLLRLALGALRRPHG